MKVAWARGWRSRKIDEYQTHLILNCSLSRIRLVHRNKNTAISIWIVIHKYISLLFRLIEWNRWRTPLKISTNWNWPHSGEIKHQLRSNAYFSRIDDRNWGKTWLRIRLNLHKRREMLVGIHTCLRICQFSFHWTVTDPQLIIAMLILWAVQSALRIWTGARCTQISRISLADRHLALLKIAKMAIESSILRQVWAIKWQIID